LGVLAVAAVVSLGLGAAVARGPTLRVALAAGAIVSMVALGLRRPTHQLYVLVVWLSMLGMFRRVISQLSPFSLADPLLLVAPLAWAALVVKAAERGCFHNRTPLANAVGLMSLFVLVAAINPLQPNLVAGLAGLLFLLVPLLAFWVGRTLERDAMGRVLKLVALLAIPAAGYGLFQALRGFPVWDDTWVRTSGYAALNVGGVIRPFGSFSSAAEYASFVAIGFVLFLVFWFRATTLGPALGAMALLGTAIVVEASRSIVVFLLVGLALVASVRARLPRVLSGVLVVGALLGLVVVSRHVAPEGLGTGGRGDVSKLVAHNVSGLANPLDARSSTLPLHLNTIAQGLQSPLHYPLGRGPAAVTIANRKLADPGDTEGGEAQVGGTEVDPSNIAVALGVPGFLLYLVILVLGFRTAHRLAASGREVVAVGCLGVLGVTLLQWFNGGMYAVAPLAWLALGYVDGQAREL
jgi:hypothetical protein